MKRVLLGVMFIGLSFSQARASDANELLASCEALLRGLKSAGEERVLIVPEGRACWYYMEAIQDLSVLVDRNRQRVLRICPPSEVRLTQYVRVFTEHARRHPAELHHSGARLALRALTEAFPCR